MSSSMSAAALEGSISKAIWAQSARALLCGIEPALRMSTPRNDVTKNRTFPYVTFSIFRAAVQQSRPQFRVVQGGLPPLRFARAGSLVASNSILASRSPRMLISN